MHDFIANSSAEIASTIFFLVVCLFGFFACLAYELLFCSLCFRETGLGGDY